MLLVITIHTFSFQGLDFVISEAKKYGIHLILSLVNNWDDFGGKKQYVQWARDHGGQYLNSDDDFFTNIVVKGYYKNHLKVYICLGNNVSIISQKFSTTAVCAFCQKIWACCNYCFATDHSYKTQLNHRGWLQGWFHHLFMGANERTPLPVWSIREISTGSCFLCFLTVKLFIWENARINYLERRKSFTFKW